MTSSGLISFALLVVTVGIASFAVIKLRPAVARTVLQRQASEIRTTVVESILAGDIPPDDEAATSFIGMCDMVADGKLCITFSDAYVVSQKLHARGVEPTSLYPDSHYNQMTAAGRRTMHDAEAAFDSAVASYFIHGSALWWILAPAQRIWRLYVGRRQSPAGGSANPTHVATDWRISSQSRAGGSRKFEEMLEAAALIPTAGLHRQRV
ncbi:hypothetical protein [Prescottella equi]|uniref:hypothetical protein n=1 Tax=Rhodococcus hoagii TaxID=43767 RepID=UPI000A0FE39D|nr:hypothetical protein [Prescottella equi]ORM18353.1 hypothetical protein A5N74_12185 [Prescottella equi]